MITAICACGARHSAPDAWAGRQAKCPTCGALFRIPEAPAAKPPTTRRPLLARPPVKPARSRKTSVAIAVAVLVLAAIGQFGLNSRKPSEYQPTKRETVQERARAASEGFKPAPAEPIVTGTDEAKVRQTLEALIAAHGHADGDGFVRLFHLRRLLAEVEAGGALPQIRTASQEEAFLRGTEKGLAQSIRALAGSLLQWKGVQVVRVRFLPARPEAEAFTWVRLGVARAKFRFWLIKEGASWKVFDFESIEDGLRITTAMASVAGSAFDPAGSAKIQRAVRAVKEAVALMTTDLDKAAAVLRRARAENPHVLILNQLDILEGMVLNAQGKNEEALALFDRALARRKDLPMAHHGRGQVFFALEKHEEAIRAENEYLALVGDDAEGLATVGQSLEALKRTDEAVAAFRRGAASDDEDWTCRQHLARLLVGQKKVREALPFFLEACRRAPADENVFGEAAEALEEAQAWEALLELSRDEVKRGLARGRYTEGLSLRRLARYADAEAALRAGLEKDEDWKQAYRKELVYTLAARGRHPEATALVDEMEKETPGGVDARYHRAYVLASAKKTPEALEALRSLLKEFPAWHDTIAKEPVFEGLLKDKALAAALAVAKEKSDYDEAVEKSDDSEEIVSLSRKRLERAPDDADAWTHLGRALGTLKKPAEAEKALRTAIEKSPQDKRSTAMVELGRALAALGRTDEALSLAEKIAADPERKASALSLKAEVLATARREAEAAAALVELLETHPFFSASVEANEILESVRKRPEVQAALKKAKAAKKE